MPFILNKVSFWLSLILLTCSFFLLEAQEVNITRVKITEEGQVVLRYNLSDDNPERKYTLRLYASTDNYIEPLKKVSGAVGTNQPQGQNRQVIWNAKEELGADFAGDIGLELKGQVYVPFIELTGFGEDRTFRRGKSYDLTWVGGRGDNILNFELYKENVLVQSFEERPNIGNTTLTIPKKIKTGLYRLRISDENNRDEEVYSSVFKIKPKTPLVSKLGIATVLTGAGIYLFQDPPPGPEGIGDPPLPR